MSDEQTISIYGVEIPVRDHLTGLEMIEMEVLLAKGDITQTRADIEAVSIFALTRAGVALDVDKQLMKQPLPDNLDEAVRALTEPFWRAARRRAERTIRERLKALEPEALVETMQQREAELEVMRDMLAEAEESNT